jgi:hypothetical protein
MSQFGQIINPDYDPRKTDIYDSFTSYFDNPVMYKIKNIDGFSMYMAKIYCMLGNTFRYLIIFVKQDLNANNSNQHMKNLEWVSLQTRTLDENHVLKPHAYTASRHNVLNQSILLKDRTEEESTYECDLFPLTISLLHTKKGSKYQYQAKGTIVSALETYQTIIVFKD